MKNALRYVALGGIFILPFIVFIVSNSLFFPYITGKNFFFRIVVEIIFAAWAVLALMDARYRPKFSWLLAITAAFIGLIALADIFGAYPARSFWSNFERMEGLVTLLHLLAYVIVVAGVIKAESLWSKLWNTLVAVSFIEGLYILGQLGGAFDISLGGDRADGTFGNPIYLAGFMLVSFFITLWLLYRTYTSDTKPMRFWKVTFYISALALQALSIFASGTRGTMLGMAGGLALASVLIAIFGRWHPRLRKASIGIVVAILVIGGSLYLLRESSFVQNTPVLERITSISMTEGTGAARIRLWSVAWDSFKQKPILGWGQENYIEAFSQNYDPILYSEEPWFDRAHNIVLDWLAAGGFLGVVSYLGIWVLLVFSIWRRGNAMPMPEKAILTGLLGAYFFHNLFVFDNIVSYILFFTFIGYIHFRATEEREEASGWEMGGVAQKSLASGVAGVLLVLAIWQLNVRAMQTSKDLIQGLSLSRANAEQALPYFEEAVEGSFLGRSEARIQVTITASQVARSDASAEVKEKYFSLLTRVMEAQIKENPETVRDRLLYGFALNSFGEYEKAVSVLKEGIEISPGKQELYETLGASYMGAGEYEKALESYEGAWQLYPAYYQLRTGSVKALIELGRTEEARELIFDERANERFITGEMIQSFIDAGDFDSAKKVIEELLANEPGSAQTLVSVSAAYLQMGERGSAIELLEQAIKISPSFAPQGQLLIEEIRAGGNPLAPR